MSEAVVCPKCGSDDTASIEVVYLSQHHNTSSTGIGVAGDSIGVAAFSGTTNSLLGERVAALGGVRPELLPTLRDLGFGGAALLGCIWRDVSSAGLRETLQRIQRYNRP